MAKRKRDAANDSRAHIGWLPRLSGPQRAAFLATLDPRERAELRWHWRLWARAEQLAPAGPWRNWLICAGRGFGKTRAGAEWVPARWKRGSRPCRPHNPAL